MPKSPRLALPFISAGQAQKELFHNEALQTLDAVVAAAVEEPPRSAPPASPGLGSCYIVASSPTGAWSGHVQCLAVYSSGGWRFVQPAEGLVAYVKTTGVWAVYRAGAWELGVVRGSTFVISGQQVVGPRLPPVAVPSGGTIVDSEARATIGDMLSALRQHGLIEM